MKLVQQITDYLRASAEEVKKVAWPSQRDTIRYSALVIGASIVIAAFFAALDVGFTKLVDFSITQRVQSNQPTQTDQTTQPVTSSSTPASPIIDFSDVQPIITPMNTSTPNVTTTTK